MASTTAGGNVTLTCTGSTDIREVTWYLFTLGQDSLSNIEQKIGPHSHIGCDTNTHPNGNKTVFSITLSNLTVTDNNSLVTCVGRNSDRSYSVHPITPFVLQVLPASNTSTPPPPPTNEVTVMVENNKTIYRVDNNLTVECWHTCADDIIPHWTIQMPPDYEHVTLTANDFMLLDSFLNDYQLKGAMITMDSSDQCLEEDRFYFYLHVSWNTTDYGARFNNSAVLCSATQNGTRFSSSRISSIFIDSDRKFQSTI